MKANKKKKDFDCVEMKNAIQAKIYAETKDMSPAEVLAYFNIPPEQDIFRRRTNVGAAASANANNAISASAHTGNADILSAQCATAFPPSQCTTDFQPVVPSHGSSRQPSTSNFCLT